MYNNTTVRLSEANMFPNLYKDEKNHSVFSCMVTLSTSIAIAILSPVAVVGNGLVLTAIWRNLSLRTPSYILLAGLAFTDLSTGLIAQPFYVAMKLISLTDPLPNKTTVLIITAIANGSATYFIPMTTSIITVMSIERWLHMTRRSFLTVRRVYYTVFGLSLLPIPIVVHHVLIIRNNAGYLTPVHMTSISILLFCLIVTSVAYFKVFRIIRSHQQQIQANNLSQVSGQPAISFAKYKKSVFTVLYILAIFYVTYSPLAITFGLFLYWENGNHYVTGPFLDVSIVFIFLSSSLNPILYLWRMSDIRNEVISLAKAVLCKVN